jgi:hypothetical protein
MSYWVSRLQCKTCGSEINVSGGMVQTTWMGPADRDLICPNTACRAVGFDSFNTIVHNIDTTTNPEYREFTIRDIRNERTIR